MASTLRRKNLESYVDAQGAALFDLAWSDAALVDAAFRVFVEDLRLTPYGDADQDLSLIPRQSMTTPAHRSRHAGRVSLGQLALPLFGNEK